MKDQYEVGNVKKIGGPLQMSRQKKRRQFFSTKIIILISSVIALSYLLTLSGVVWARSNERSVTSSLQDTLRGINGTVVDSITDIPIPFATILFFKDGSGSMTIMSDAKGRFSTDVKRGKTTVQLSAIGYETRTFYLSAGVSNLLRLAPADNHLPEVTVSGKSRKKPDANRIMKKVNRNIPQNYGEISFDQKFKGYSTTHNYDTTKAEINYLINIHFNNYLRTMMSKNWREDTVICDDPFFKLIGVPSLLAGDIIPSSDLLRKGFPIGEKQRKVFEFKMLAHYQDKKYGSVYHVSFRPRTTFKNLSLGGRTIGGLSWAGNTTGEMLIREDDYAVVSLKYLWEMKVEMLNASTEGLYRTPHWHADRVRRIILNSMVYKYEYSYDKDTLTGKYFVQAIKAECYNTGYQIENHRKVQLNYLFDLQSMGVENIVE